MHPPHGDLKKVHIATQSRDPSPDLTDTQVPDTLEQSKVERLKLHFAFQSRPAGTEVLPGNESVLDLFANQEGDFSPIPSGTDNPSESYGSRVWDDDKEDQEVERYLLTRPTRDPKDSLAGQIASNKATRIDRKEKHRDSSASGIPAQVRKLSKLTWR